MISPNDIKIKAERKYVFLLQAIVQEVPFSRLIIPGDKSYSKSLSDFEKEILGLVNHSKGKRGYGYTIDYQIVKTKTIGTQSLPTNIYFDSEKDFLKYLGKEREVEFFRQNIDNIISVFPELKDWTFKNPMRVIQNQNEWDRLLRVCIYFKNNPKPNLYIRELPIKVHTKFIEQNQSIIKDILDIIIAPFITAQEKYFEKRFNLKYSEAQIRFKVLDKDISQSYFSGLDDLAIPVSQFEKLQLPVIRVLIVENKTTLYTTLTLPKIKKTIAIFGSGYSVYNLKNVEWLRDMDLIYWGDIDVQGFEILSQFRGYFPNAKSILMDKITFDRYFENDLGPLTNVPSLLNLNDDEKKLYDLLKANNWRLEQEKLPLEYVNTRFENVTN